MCVPCPCMCVCVSLALLLPLRVRTTFCYPWLFQPRHTPPKQLPLPWLPSLPLPLPLPLPRLPLLQHTSEAYRFFAGLACPGRVTRRAPSGAVCLYWCASVCVCVFAKGEAQLWAQLFLVAPFPLQRNVNEPRRSKAAAAAAMIISGIISNFR